MQLYFNLLYRDLIEIEKIKTMFWCLLVISYFWWNLQILWCYQFLVKTSDKFYEHYMNHSSGERQCFQWKATLSVCFSYKWQASMRQVLNSDLNQRPNVLIWFFRLCDFRMKGIKNFIDIWQNESCYFDVNLNWSTLYRPRIDYCQCSMFHPRFI